MENILDDIMKLEPEDRILITDVLNRRRIEEERRQIARLARESVAEYKKGMYKPLTAEEGLKEINI